MIGRESRDAAPSIAKNGLRTPTQNDRAFPENHGAADLLRPIEQ